MAAPCITDTCSMTSAIDAVTRQLSLDVRLDPQGGLTCNDPDGLAVAIYEDPGTAGALVDACLNGLRRTGGGELLAVSPRAGLATASGTIRSVPLNGNESATSFTMNTTNPHDCSVLTVVLGRFEMTYQIVAAGEFNADMRCRILRDGTAVAATFMDIGGYANGAVAGSVKRRYDYFIDIFTSGGGASHTWTATANHEGGNEDDNIDTFSENLGFRAVADVLYLPFNTQAA